MSLISSSQIEKGHEQDWIGELIITLKPEYSLSGRHWYLKPTCFCLKKHQTYKDHRVLLLNPRIKTRNLILNEDLIQTNLQWIHKIATILRVWLIKLLIFALKAFESLLFRAESGLCPCSITINFVLKPKKKPEPWSVHLSWFQIDVRHECL